MLTFLKHLPQPIKIVLYKEISQGLKHLAAQSATPIDDAILLWALPYITELLEIDVG